MEKELKKFNYKGLSECSGVDYTKLNRSIAYQSGKVLSATERKKVIDSAKKGLETLIELYSKQDGL